MEKTLLLYALQKIPFLGPTKALNLVKTNEWHEYTEKLTFLKNDAWEELEAHRQAGVHIISYFDPEYPSRLQHIKNPPPLLYAQGNINNLHQKTLAVVGTRKPSLFGKTAAEYITHYICEKGWGVTSGLALGIDTLAHRRALSFPVANIAILGCGLDTCYPRENSSLAHAIIENGGLLLSEVPFGHPPRPGSLIARDRLQSALSEAVVICESTITGGSMHTARFAYEQNIPLFVAKPHVSSESTSGNDALLSLKGKDISHNIPAWKNIKIEHSEPIARPLERDNMSLLFVENKSLFPKQMTLS